MFIIGTEGKSSGIHLVRKDPLYQSLQISGGGAFPDMDMHACPNLLQRVVKVYGFMVCLNTG